MTSKADATEAFVWIWLPGATEPVVAGRLFQEGERLLFNYGASYRGRKSAIPIYEPELPLQEGAIAPINGLQMASCIRDGSPDAWGRRVIINRLTGKKPDADGVPEISELTYLLHSGSDRTGALDFQASATEYVPRRAAQASLDELMRKVALSRASAGNLSGWFAAAKRLRLAASVSAVSASPSASSEATSARLMRFRKSGIAKGAGLSVGVSSQ